MMKKPRTELLHSRNLSGSYSRQELREQSDRGACAAAANCFLSYFREFAVRLPGLNADLAIRI